MAPQKKMEAKIKLLPKKILVGKSMRMSLAKNKTPELWKNFMTHRKAINKTIGSTLYSIQVYDNQHYFKNFNPHTEFTKWAATEIGDYKNIPNGFIYFTLEAGLYAIFLHKGPASDFQKTWQFIFSQWMPNSEYELDNRPHFELLGPKYKNNDPKSEEEVWIPIRKKE